MKIVLQKVKNASCRHEDNIICEIGEGIILFVGIEKDDSEDALSWMAKKILSIKLYDKWTNSVKDKNFEVLVLSQFTVFAEFNGLKPKFNKSEIHHKAEVMFFKFCGILKEMYSREKVVNGVFGKKLNIFYVNDGPFTAILEK